jgi:hypothetical protein
MLAESTKSIRQSLSHSLFLSSCQGLPSLQEASKQNVFARLPQWPLAGFAFREKRRARFKLGTRVVIAESTQGIGQRLTYSLALGARQRLLFLEQASEEHVLARLPKWTLAWFAFREERHAGVKLRT